MTSFVMTSFSTKWLNLIKNFRISKGDVIDFFDHFVIINPNFDILSSFFFSSSNFITFYLSYMAGDPIFSHSFYHLCVIVNYSAKNIYQNSVFEKYSIITILCVHTNTRSIDIASWGTPSPSSAIYNFGHSVRGRANGT